MRVQEQAAEDTSWICTVAWVVNRLQIKAAAHSTVLSPFRDLEILRPLLRTYHNHNQVHVDILDGEAEGAASW